MNAGVLGAVGHSNMVNVSYAIEILSENDVYDQTITRSIVINQGEKNRNHRNSYDR
jgi:hypothetical protein